MNQQQNPLNWFEDLVKEYPGAENYRSDVQNVERLVIEALDIADQARNQARDSAKKFLIDLLTSMWDKSSAYTTAVISVGYVALFTSWSATAGDIAPQFSRLVAVFGLSSLAVFVIFEVGKMVWQHVHVMALIRLIGHQGPAFDEAQNRYSSFSASSQKAHQWVWSFVLGLTLVLGMTSASVLVYANLERMFGL